MNEQKTISPELQEASDLIIRLLEAYELADLHRYSTSLLVAEADDFLKKIHGEEK